MWKSRFSHNASKTLIFHVLSRGKVSFLMTRQKGANLLPYYVSKLVFSWRAKNSYILCIVTWKNRFSHNAIKRCKFVALLRGKAGFLMRNRKQSVYLKHYYVSKQVFSWRAKNSYIWCIFTWKNRFSHDVTENKVYIWCIITFQSRFSRDAPKTLTFDALLRGKTGFLMMCQKGANLLHY